MGAVADGPGLATLQWPSLYRGTLTSSTNTAHSQCVCLCSCRVGYPDAFFQEAMISLHTGQNSPFVSEEGKILWREFLPYTGLILRP